MKYKVGDRVRIVDHRTKIMESSGKMDRWLGKIMTIKSIGKGRCSGDALYYKMVEDEKEFFGGGWYWDDECIAGLAEKEREPWTEEEIEKARDTVAYLVYNIVYDGGDVVFLLLDDKNGKKERIHAFADIDSFDDVSSKKAISEPRGKDIYNPWIGKYVALCKALGKPVPDFIMNKNRSDD